MTLYHFTDSRNIPSIKRYGLLSWRILVNRNIPHWPASSKMSRVLDAKRNLQGYIRLCTRCEHPMAYRAIMEGRVKELVWLEIDDTVMRWQSTLFSSENAVSKTAIINNDPQTALESSSIQAEVLICGGLKNRWIMLPNRKSARSADNSTLPPIEAYGDFPS